MVAKYPPKNVDEIFISPGNKRKEWISNFCSAIKEIGLKVSFHCQAKASDIINNQITAFYSCPTNVSFSKHPDSSCRAWSTASYSSNNLCSEFSFPWSMSRLKAMDKQLIRNTPMCYDFADENTSVFYNHMKEWNAKARKLDDFLFLAIARDIFIFHHDTQPFFFCEK